MTSVRVIKIGGNVIDNDAVLHRFLDDVATIAEPFVLVHGGGAIATSMSARLGLQTTMVEGRRVTDADTLQLVTMVYAGWINKSIVAALHARSCSAIGICGADADIVRAVRRPAEPVDYGYVGDVAHVHADALRALTTLHRCVVVAPITHDGAGQLLNTNADTMAASIAAALAPTSSVELTYVFDLPGVLRSIDDHTSVITAIDAADVSDLVANGTLTKGMLPKISNAVRAARAGASVRICGPSDVHTSNGTLVTAHG